MKKEKEGQRERERQLPTEKECAKSIAQRTLAEVPQEAGAAAAAAAEAEVAEEPIEFPTS